VEPRQGSILREVQERGVLRVATINAPTTYYEGRDGLAGFEFDLANSYAAHLGVEAQFIVLPTIEAVLDAVSNDQADIAAAGLSITDKRKQNFAFGPPYLQAAPVLVCRRGVRQIRGISDLEGLRFELANGTSFIDVIEKLRKASDKILEPVISINSVETLLADVAAKRIDCTIADEHVFSLQRRYLPTLEARLQVGTGAPLAWAVSSNPSWRKASFLRNLDHWWQQEVTLSLLAKLEERYFSVADTEFDYVDLSRLRRAMRTRLPKYRDDFEVAAKRYKLPWTLLAAVGWRESHWKANAKSQTGVRGLMMLTRVTAREQGVQNRLDPAQSIRGGARYLASLIRRLPASIAEDQRYAFALAAYNMGWGHMTDARELAQIRGLDPDQWSIISALLPELERKEVYSTVKHGYARGREGQAYVAAVLNFADIIEKAHAPVIPTSALAGSSETCVVEIDC